MRPEVPAFEERTAAPRRTRYCVIVPVLNEGERFRRQLERMRPLLERIDLIVADGGSSDGSVDDVPGTVLVKRGPGRLGAQMRMGFWYALEQGYEGCVLVDGNDKDDVCAIPRFVEKLEEGFDFVQGSRYVAGGQGVNTPFYRHVGVTLLHAPVLSLASWHRYTDTTNGFRAYSARFLRDDRVALFRDVFAGYELHYYLSMRAARLGFRVCEIPVTRSYPAEGPTPSKISPVRGSLNVLKALGNTVLGRYNP